MPNGDAGTFHRAEYIDLTLDQLIADADGTIDRSTAQRLYNQMKKEVLYKSEHYQVAIDKSPTHGFRGMILWHLSIKRNDKAPIMDWRDLQDIKNKLVGVEHEAIQLFPAESRCVDSANQYHLFAFMKEGKQRQPMIPIGWTSRFKTDDPWVNGGQRGADGEQRYKQRPMGNSNDTSEGQDGGGERADPAQDESGRRETS